jgi:N-acetylmuramoyl-L-alanine amidase
LLKLRTTAALARGAQILSVQSLQSVRMRLPLIGIGVVLLALTGLLPSFENEKLVVFGSRGRVEADTVTENGVSYVNLGGVLLSEGGFSTKAIRDGIRYELGGRRIEVRAGARELRSDGKAVKLEAAARVRDDQAWIPANNVVEVLRVALKRSAMLRGGRLMIGDTPDFITTEYRPGEPSTVILHFNRPVNPVIDTSEGRVTLEFRNDPVAMNTTKIDYGDRTFQHLEFSEAKGLAQIEVRGAVPLMAKFEDGNHRIVITPAPPAAAAATPPPSPPATTATTTPETPAPEAAAPSPSATEPTGTPEVAHPGTRTALVAIDPAHGGNDAGVKFSDKLLEKNVSLAIAEKLRAELNNRGISAIMLRAGDDDVNPDDRAEAANAARVSYYIAIHAGQLGSGVRVFTPLRSASAATNPLFKPWDQVQADQVEKSNRFAADLSSQFAEKKIAVRQFAGNAAPLAHVAAAAVSIEVAPDHDDEGTLESSVYIQKVAQAVATAVAQEKGRQ